MSAWLQSRALRRLLVAVACLVAVDPLVTRVLAPAERVRYESSRLLRFENSDLFPLGPLVEYLREHPIGSRPRTVFLGSSVVWGYLLRPGQTLPAQYQRLVPEVRVLNLGINGFDSDSAYLITKQIVEAVDVLYLFESGRRAHYQLPQLIPVDDADLARFGLRAPDRWPRWLQECLGFWRLYHYSYRLQAAFLGTSTRVFLYLNSGNLKSLFRDRSRDVPEAPPAVTPGDVAIDAPVALAAPSPDRLRALAARRPLLWDYAALVQGHGKRAVVVQADGRNPLTAEDRADLNAHFQPHVRFVRLHVRPSLLLDGQHLTAAGAAAVAAALRDLR
jgi:hypothetical protein